MDFRFQMSYFALSSPWLVAPSLVALEETAWYIA
jgi:hypothetical protein